MFNEGRSDNQLRKKEVNRLSKTKDRHRKNHDDANREEVRGNPESIMLPEAYVRGEAAASREIASYKGRLMGKIRGIHRERPNPYEKRMNPFPDAEEKRGKEKQHTSMVSDASVLSFWGEGSREALIGRVQIPVSRKVMISQAFALCTNRPQKANDVRNNPQCWDWQNFAAQILRIIPCCNQILAM